MKRLQGKKCVVVGGTSGIGRAIAAAFVKEGAIVIPSSRSWTKVKEAVQFLKDAGNRFEKILTVDVLKEASVAQLAVNSFKILGPIDVVVCTAGCHLKKDFLEMTTREWQKVLDTNLTGTYYVNKHFGSCMLQQKGGSLINLSSLGAKVALSEADAYCVSKAAVSMLTKSLAIAWAEKGVRVNALVPGVFPTPLNEKALSIPKRRKNILSKTPLGRFGKLSEITGAAVYLASDEASFVTGTEITVDGGFLASSGF